MFNGIKKITLLSLALFMSFAINGVAAKEVIHHRFFGLNNEIQTPQHTTPYLLKNEDNQTLASIYVTLDEMAINVVADWQMDAVTNQLTFYISPSDPLNEKSLKLVLDGEGNTQLHKTIRSGNQYVYKPTNESKEVEFVKQAENVKLSMTFSIQDFGLSTPLNHIFLLPVISDKIDISHNISIPFADPFNASSYLKFTTTGYSKSSVSPGVSKNIDADLADWADVRNLTIEDQQDQGKQIKLSAFKDSHGIYVAAEIHHNQKSIHATNLNRNMYVEIKFNQRTYRLSSIMTHRDVSHKMITLPEGSGFITWFEAFIPYESEKQFERLGFMFYSPKDDFVPKGLQHEVPSDKWYHKNHRPGYRNEDYFIYADGLYETAKNNGIPTGETLGASQLGYLTTTGFNVSGDKGINTAVSQRLMGEQKIYFNQLLSSNYMIHTGFNAIKSYGEDKSRIGIIAAETDTKLIAWMLDYKTQIHGRVMVKDKITQIWTDELINVQLDLKQANMTISAVRNGNRITFYANGKQTFSKVYDDLNGLSVGGLMTMGYDVDFHGYYQSTDQNVISNFEQYTSQIRGKIMMTIADSIFDFTDNKIADMVQNIAYGTGYNQLFIDNIGGTTIAPLNGRSIVEHIDQGLYESYPVPDILIIERGTNDAAFVYNGKITLGTVGNGDKNTTFGAIDYVMNYFRQLYPDTRIIWTNAIYRNGLPAETHQSLHDALLAIAPTYDVEVFDVRSAVGINQSNYLSYLYDGVHLNDAGKVLMQNAFIEYINQDN